MTGAQNAGDIDDFEGHRRHLHAVAYRMLGSLSEADDAVQEAWLRLHRSDTAGVVNLRGWLTTVVARVALDMLRARVAKREEPLDALPDPVVDLVGHGDDPPGPDPEGSAILADSVSLALLVVLDSLSPSERLVFVLHDLFGVPFEEVGPIAGRSPAAAKQLASRARGRIRGRVPGAPIDPHRHRAMVSAFRAAAGEGDLEALLAVLDPDVSLRVDTAGGLRRFRGARQVAAQAAMFSHLAPHARAAVVNGAPGLVTVLGGELIAVQSFTVADDVIVGIDLFVDPQRLRRLPLVAREEGAP